MNKDLYTYIHFFIFFVGLQSIPLKLVKEPSTKLQEIHNIKAKTYL